MKSSRTVLEQLVAQRARLLLALGNTSRSVKFEDREIEHFSPDELLTAISGIDAQLSAMTGQDTNRLFVVASSSGLGGDGHCCGGGDAGSDRYEAWR